jgi:hypothetical protein
MDSMEKKLEKILQVYEKCYKESEIQRDPRYMKFKLIKLKSAHQVYINRLIHLMVGSDFKEESIYWHKRLLDIIDICNKRKRYEIYTAIIQTYYKLQNHEMVLKYGSEAIQDMT